jgi:hypothetical protein
LKSQQLQTGLIGGDVLNGAGGCGAGVDDDNFHAGGGTTVAVALVKKDPAVSGVKGIKPHVGDLII